MEKVKIALIGAGNIANAHLRSYRDVADAQIYAICDINKETLNETADRYGISRRYTDVDTMLEELPELDAADVCVWNCNHASCAIKALNAGLHVLCEKPMAYNTAEAEQMLSAAKKNGKTLMIGFVCRMERESVIARDFIENGELGELFYSKISFLRRHGNPGGWFADQSRSGGGPIIDLGVHVIDLVRFLMGKPNAVSVYAATYARLGKRAHLKNTVSYHPRDARDEDPSTVEDLASVMIRFDNGATVNLEASFDANIPKDVFRYELHGTKGTLVVDGSDVNIYTEVNGFLSDVRVATENYRGFPRPEFVEEMARFVACVKDGAPCPAPGEDGIAIMKILDAIYESAKTGHEVTIK